MLISHSIGLCDQAIASVNYHIGAESLRLGFLVEEKDWYDHSDPNDKAVANYLGEHVDGWMRRRFYWGIE